MLVCQRDLSYCKETSDFLWAYPAAEGPQTEWSLRCLPLLPARVSVRVACSHHSQVKETASQWPCMSAHEAVFFFFCFFFLHADAHTQKSWGRSFVMWRGIFSHAPLRWGLRLKAFLWKFMAQQLWSHPPLCGARGRCRPRNYEGHPIHSAPPINLRVFA